MGVIGWIAFGFVVGLVAKLLMPGRDPAGFLVTVAIGIVGAVIGGYLGRLLGLYHENEPAGFLMAVVGAILLLWGYRAIAARQTP